MEKVSNRDLGKFFNQWLFVAGQPDLKIYTGSGKRKGFTDLIIEQTQDKLFSFEIELQIKDLKGTHMLKIPVSDRITKKTIRIEKIIEVLPDPDINLLFRIVPDERKTTIRPKVPVTE
jgi:hypothetical protein